MALSYAEKDAGFQRELKELCQELSAHHGNYRIPIHEGNVLKAGASAAFVLDAPTYSRGHNARITWKPGSKTIYRDLDGKISKGAVSPAAELAGELRRALIAFSNPLGYYHAAMLSHPEYGTVEKYLVARRMNETRTELPEGTWSAQAYAENLKTQCVIDTDIPRALAGAIRKENAVAPRVAKAHKERMAKYPYHEHTIALHQSLATSDVVLRREPRGISYHYPLTSLLLTSLLHAIVDGALGEGVVDRFNRVIEHPSGHDDWEKANMYREERYLGPTRKWGKFLPNSNLIEASESLREAVLENDDISPARLAEYEDKAVDGIAQMRRAPFGEWLKARMHREKIQPEKF
jgi:hypothetical protein